MEHVKLKHFSRPDMASGEDWSQALEVSAKYLAKKMQKRWTFIACIPFVRNISEYTGGDGEGTTYKKLTSCLHLKDDTAGIKMDDIHTLFKGQVKVANDKAIDFGGENYLAALFEEAERIMGDDNEIDIVNKLVLSMAIRLKAEEYMGKVLTEEQKAEM